ncbi:MAG: esterase [Pyrinomonadaceae bacterium]|nr:esterase [Pyrinomonadaceae bacterium]
MNERGKIVVEQITSEVLRGNFLGDPHVRELFIYLPPSYERDTTRRFPVVYCLTGFTGRGQMLLNTQPFSPNLAERMDNLLATGEAGEMILVMPDCFTRLGGSQYINSTATGRYEDHLVEEIVSFVDRRFRTRVERAGRAVVGKSSGGYGALRCACRHADTFSVAVSHSGDCYFEYGYLPDFPKTFRAIRGDAGKFIENFWSEEKKGKDDITALNIIAMSACYSPDKSAPLGFRLPFNTTTGEIDNEVWARWLAHDPVRMVEHHADALRSLKLLYLDAGTRDEFHLDAGARILSARLRKHNINFIHEEFDDGHMNISYRYNRSLALISEALEA